MSRHNITYCVVAQHEDGIAVRVFGGFKTEERAKIVRDRIARIAMKNGGQWRVAVRTQWSENDGTRALTL